jgi:GT2 family glycosyltransferase
MQSLASLAALPQIERIVVVDDGCETPVQNQAFRNLRVPVTVVRQPVSRGPEAARNLAMSVVDSEWCLHSDDDIVFPPDYLEQLIACQQRWKADIVAGRLIFLQPDEKPADALERCQGLRAARGFPNFPLETNWSTPFSADVEVLHLPNACLMRSSLCRQVGWDPISFPPPSCFRGDTDFFLRSVQAGARLIWSPTTAAYHLPQQLTSSGGCRNAPLLARKISLLRNNHRFLKRHHGFLKSRGMIGWPRIPYELRSGINQTVGGYLLKNRFWSRFLKMLGLAQE